MKTSAPRQMKPRCVKFSNEGNSSGESKPIQLESDHGSLHCPTKCCLTVFSQETKNTNFRASCGKKQGEYTVLRRKHACIPMW